MKKVRCDNELRMRHMSKQTEELPVGMEVLIRIIPNKIYKNSDSRVSHVSAVAMASICVLAGFRRQLIKATIPLEALTST
jgi:hypothetical protein